jgi:branched-chain amino acid aminotransferase
VPFIWISRPEQQEAGARMRISDLTRIPPQSVDPTVKNYHWLDLDLALLDAYDHDADLVVLRDLSGAISEGPGYNVFAHVDGRWLTPGRCCPGGSSGRPAPAGPGGPCASCAARPSWPSCRA